VSPGSVAAGKRTGLGVRIVLGVAVAAVVGALLLDASRAAPRGAGSDHTSTALIAATVKGGETLCQPGAFLSNAAARVQLLIGTYGRPLPEVRVVFLDDAMRAVALGHQPGGGHEGLVTIPIAHTRPTPASTTVCIHVGGSHPIALAGETGPINPSSETVAGHQQPGRVSLAYFRKGDESWWSLLPELTSRFGLGKASFFGDWTLPVAALLLLGVWVAAIRLMLRELT
jgi:hypothetical protein